MKVIECDDEKKLVHFYEKKMAAEVDGACLGDEYAGYVFRCVLAPERGAFVCAAARGVKRGRGQRPPGRAGLRRAPERRLCIPGAGRAGPDLPAGGHAAFGVRLGAPLGPRARSTELHPADGSPAR